MYKHKITTTAEIGAKIKKRRRELKISQEELAEILDVTYQQIQRYENGVNKLNVENIQVIAEALSVPLSYFFETLAKADISEDSSHYLTAEESRLLRHFRKIKRDSLKNTVIDVAKLATR